MAQWQTAEAKQRFSELVEAASGQGPQVVMRHKEAVAVVLSPEDYRRPDVAGSWSLNVCPAQRSRLLRCSGRALSP